MVLAITIDDPSFPCGHRHMAMRTFVREVAHSPTLETYSNSDNRTAGSVASPIGRSSAGVRLPARPYRPYCSGLWPANQGSHRLTPPPFTDDLSGFGTA